MHQVGTLLQVARIFARLAVNETRVRRRYEITWCAGLRHIVDQKYHGWIGRLAHTRRAPHSTGIEPPAQLSRHELLTVALQFIARRAIGNIRRETLAPILAPLRLVIALHDEHELFDVVRHD